MPGSARSRGRGGRDTLTGAATSCASPRPRHCPTPPTRAIVQRRSGWTGHDHVPVEQIPPVRAASARGRGSPARFIRPRHRVAVPRDHGRGRGHLLPARRPHRSRDEPRDSPRLQRANGPNRVRTRCAQRARSRACSGNFASSRSRISQAALVAVLRRSARCVAVSGCRGSEHDDRSHEGCDSRVCRRVWPGRATGGQRGDRASGGMTTRST